MPKQAIVERLEAYGEFDIRYFGDEAILGRPVSEWPTCDCLLSWHSDGFPLAKVPTLSLNITSLFSLTQSLNVDGGIHTRAHEGGHQLLLSRNKFTPFACAHADVAPAPLWPGQHSQLRSLAALHGFPQRSCQQVTVKGFRLAAGAGAEVCSAAQALPHQRHGHAGRAARPAQGLRQAAGAPTHIFPHHAHSSGLAHEAVRRGLTCELRNHVLPEHLHGRGRL